MNYPFPKIIVNPALGTDLAGTYDLTPQMSESAGRQCLAENLVRRMINERGDLIDDPDYGFGLLTLLNADLSQADMPRIQSGIVHEWTKDERVVSAVVRVQYVSPTQVDAARSGVVSNPQPVPLGVLVVSATITDGDGPFRLVLAASDLTVTILEAGA